jgi:hypothetical protein
VPDVLLLDVLSVADAVEVLALDPESPHAESVTNIAQQAPRSSIIFEIIIYSPSHIKNQ